MTNAFFRRRRTSARNRNLLNSGLSASPKRIRAASAGEIGIAAQLSKVLAMRKKMKHSGKSGRVSNRNVHKAEHDRHQYEPVISGLDLCVCGRPLADHYRVTVRFVGCDGAQRKRQ
jgi:hypothetical protein